MLEEVRKPSRAKSIIAYLIFGAIIVVFIGFGVVPNRIGSDVTGVAAMVNQQQINLSDFRDRVQMMERQYQMKIDQVPQSQRAELTKQLRNRALEDLIQFEALVQAAKARGVRVSDEEVRDSILEITSFQEEGRFKREFYDRFLESRGWTAAVFEEKIRKDLTLRKIQNTFQAALKTSQDEKAKENWIENTKLNLEFVTLSEDTMKSKVNITQAEATSWLSQAENEKAVQSEFDSNPQAFSKPEEVRARHILVSFDKSNPQSVQDAEKKAQEILEKSKKVDFAKLAKEYSEDPGSKEKGGDLGYFSRGRMVPEFEKAAFEQPVGQIGSPVKSDFGFHIIKVEDKKAAQQPQLSEVKIDLAKKLMLKTRVSDLLKQVSEKVSQGEEPEVRKTLKSLGFEWSETGAFSLDAPQIPKLNESDAVMEAIVKYQAKPGLIPEPINSMGQMHIVILKSFEFGTGKSEKSQFEDLMGSRKYYDAFNTWAKDVVAKAKIQRNALILNQ